MTSNQRLRPVVAISLHIGLLAACGCLAAYIHSIIAAETLSDGMALTLLACTLVGFICATLVAIVAGARARSMVERVALRVIPVGFILVAALFVETSYAQMSIAIHYLTADDAHSTATVIELGPRGDDVRLSGDLTDGVGDRLAALLAAHPGVKRIHLTSDGGLVDEGEALRRTIAAHKLTTFVPDYCVSACTLAFMGGRDRVVLANARLGFHAPYEEGMFGQLFPGDKVTERATYIATGITPDFVDRALKVAPSDIWTPDPRELIAAHVATAVADRYTYPDSNLDGMADLGGARATVLRNFPLAKVLLRWRPDVVDTMAAWYLDAYERELPEGEVVDRIGAMIGAASATALVHSDDDTLIGVARFVLAALQATDDDSDCADLGRRADLYRAEQTLDESQGDADTLAVAFLDRAVSRPVVADGAGAEQGRPIDATPAALHGAASACSAMRGAYAGLLRKPRPEAAAILRSLIGQAARERWTSASSDTIAH